MVRIFGKRGEKLAVGVEKTRRTWFRRIAGLLDRSQFDEDLWEELEEALISADVGPALSARLLEAVKARGRQYRAETGVALGAILQDEMVSILEARPVTLPLLAAGDNFAFPKRPYVMLIVGVNGAGKTTSIAKLAHLVAQDGKKVLLAAGDTFRPGGIEQLAIWGERAGAEVISHSHGADPGAVVFDALKAARARDSSRSSSSVV